MSASEPQCASCGHTFKNKPDPTPPTSTPLDEARRLIGPQGIAIFERHLDERSWSVDSVDDMAEAVITGWYGYGVLAVAYLIAAAKAEAVEQYAIQMVAEGFEQLDELITEPF